MSSTIPSLLPLYSGQNSGDFLNYSDRKLGLKWAMAGYNFGAHYTHANDSGYAIAGSDRRVHVEPTEGRNIARRAPCLDPDVEFQR